MDELNLMQFNSPIVDKRALSPSITDIPKVSPGNNPFDSVLKHAEDLCNTPIKICTTFQPSPIITDDFFKITDIQNYGRESMGCLWDNDLSGRESLGILKLDAMNISFNNDNLNVPRVCKSQLSILEEQKSKDYSNSPLNTAFLHPLSYLQRKRSILSSASSVSTNPSLFFNSGSLEASEPSKIYSLNSTKNNDFISKSEDDLNNAFLQTYINNLKSSDTFLNNSMSCFELGSKEHNENRERLLSLPVLKTKNLVSTEENVESVDIKKNALECEQPSQNEYEIKFVPVRNVAEESFIENVKDTDESFNDSVFIEANHLASKIADGSILLHQSFEENLLDCTSPPSFDDFEESDDLKIDTETVFKFIDKMLPVKQSSTALIVKENCNNDVPPNSEGLSVSNVDSVNNNNPSEWQGSNTSTTEYRENNKNSSKNKSKVQSMNLGNCSSGSSVKSKDANELLQDLSIIINNEYKDKKKKEGQQLLSSLANILCSNGSNKYDNLEDSGHSSIEPDQNDQELNECYEVLDLRVVASKSNENEQVLDLSMSSKVETTNKRLSQSFSFSKPTFPPTKFINVLKTHTSLKSSTSSLESSRGEPGKLKPKKCEEKSSGIKKGPLKAVIPLGNMSRRKSLSKIQSTSSTPPKVEQQGNSSLFKVKRTSTPTAEPKLKPLAQSTPDSSKPNLDRSRPISCSSQLKKRKFYCPVSPLARPSSIGDASTNNVDINKSNHSGSAPNLSNNSGNVKKSTTSSSSIPAPKTMSRRHSATELKTSENNSLRLKRSYSIGKDLKTPTSVLNKMKENVCAALSNAKRNSIGSSKVVGSNQKNNVLHERNSGVTSKIKPLSLLGRLKKSAGKEN